MLVSLSSREGGLAKDSWHLGGAGFEAKALASHSGGTGPLRQAPGKPLSPHVESGECLSGSLT